MRLPLRFHGTARPSVEPELIERVVLCADLRLETFEPASKFARIDEFLVQKPAKRSKTERKFVKNDETNEVKKPVEEDSDVEFLDEIEDDEEEVKLSLIDRCSTSSDVQGTCPICEEEIRDGTFSFSLACDHSFCSECWLQHVQMSIKEKKEVVGCMDANCSEFLTHNAAGTLLSPESALIYRQVTASSLTRQIKCPGCAATMENTGSRSINCRCDTVICTSCSLRDHQPVSCSVYKQYAAVRDGRDTEPDDTWYPLLKDLSKCPHCGQYAVKNGGCNWIHCICNLSYCNLCSRPWEQFHQRKCNNRKFKVRLVDVSLPPPPPPVNPTLINKTLSARELIEGRRKEMTSRLTILGKTEAAGVMRDLAELIRLLELAVLSAHLSAKSRRAESTIRMAFFAFANTSDGSAACLRRKCDQLRQRVAEIRKTL